jgi:molecular chaperone HtpG
MTTSAPEKFEFQTEARQLLDLMIHSIYSNREIFLRELISNASDALDKLRFESLTRTELAADDLHIRLTPDKDASTLTIEDNGIGMNRDEIIEFIGTIARSGSCDFLERMQEMREKKEGAELTPELIGQFGVGFYSSFMVADKVTLISRRAGEDIAHKWESEGDGTYTLEESERNSQGTTVILHLKPADEDDKLDDFSQEWTLRSTVKKYSDFVAYPIRMQVSREEVEKDEEGKPREGAEPTTVIKDEILNSMKAIWTRPEDEVTAEEYEEFYKHISHDWNKPLQQFSMKAEGTSEFRALLYIPEKASDDLFMRDAKHGVHLYIRRVFIMNDCKELIPEYLRFIRGVVDSEDLSLNISREILQQDRQIQRIRKGLVRKVHDALKNMRQTDEEKFNGFWKEFGRVFKEGLMTWDQKERDPVLELCRFDSTHAPDHATSLDDVIARMDEGRDTIYFITGESKQALENSPHMEAFREKGIEVLLLTEPVDEIWTQNMVEYKEKKFRSIGKGEVELGSEEEKKKSEEERKEKEKDYKSLFECLQGNLSENVKEVRLSSRLTSSPACLVTGDFDMTPQMEQLMKASGQDVPKVLRILELNAGHLIIEKLHALYEKDKDDPTLGEYAELLYGQSVLAEGGQLPDPAAFSRQVAGLMGKKLA